MRILTFCPTYHLRPKAIDAIVRQQGVEFYDTFFTNDNPFLGEVRGQYANMALNWNKMRKMALEEGYQKVWMCEDDTIPPLDALKKLLEVDAPVVTGLYASRHYGHPPNIHRKDDCPGLGAIMTWEEILAVWGQTIPCSGGATGCILIDTEIFKEFEFIVDSSHGPDVPFMWHCFKTGIKQMARLDVVCGHQQPCGDIIWPDEKTGFRIEGTNGPRDT
jgi:hypothetical protein